MTRSVELALLELFADLDALFRESDNPLGRNLPNAAALKVCRGNLGQIRRWWERATTALEADAK